MGPLSNLVTLLLAGGQRSHHDWRILQRNHALAGSTNLVTSAGRAAWHGHTRDAGHARPAPGPHARGRRSSPGCPVWQATRLDWRLCWRAGNQAWGSTVGVPQCAGQHQKIAGSTSTYAVPTGPWPLLERVEKRNPVGHAHALNGQFEEDGSAQKKTRQRLFLEEHGAGRKCIFTPAETRQIRLGGHMNRNRLVSLRRCASQLDGALQTFFVQMVSTLNA